METNPVTYSYVDLGLWDAGNTYLAAARSVTDLSSTYRYNFTSMTEWNFVIDNTAPLIAAYEIALDLQASTFHQQLYDIAFSAYYNKLYLGV